jgi:2'-5' RNA ligase
MEVIRTFLAIEIPRAVQEEVGKLQGTLRAGRADVKWVEPHNIHLTLKFLGNVPAERIEGVKSVASYSLHNHSRFVLRLAGVGAFPNPRRARVVWIGVQKGAEEARAIQEALDQGLGGIGFAREERKFTPHITIGRVRTAKNLELLGQALTQAQFSSEEFSAARIILMRSDLKPTGPVYTPLGEFALA